MDFYRITVNRNTQKLLYKNENVEMQSTCLWDETNLIPAKLYRGCYRTRMKTAKNSIGEQSEAIYLPNAQTGKVGVYIHHRRNAHWSERCV